MSDTPQSGADVLARIQPRLREDATQICLRPDLLDEWEEANEALMESQQQDVSANRLATGGVSKRTKTLAEKVQAIEAQIEEASMRVRFRAMPKDDWTVLCEQHPPRPGNDMDAILGYNPDAVLDAAVRACMIDPVFDDKSWADFVKVCNPGEWKELKETAGGVNRAVTSTPKSVWAERALSKRGAASKSPASGA
jgi:hypothetical protein